MKYLFKNASLLPEYGYAGAVYLVVDGKTITYVGTERPAGDWTREIDCHGMLLMPAFYNAHCHCAMTLFRGYGEDLPLQRWLNEKIFPAEERLSDESVYWASKLAIAEMIKNGIVSFTDMYFFIDATARAVLETGVKANLSRCIVSFDPDIDMAADNRMNEAKALVPEYHMAGDGRLRIDMSLHAEYTNVEKACRYVADYTAANKLRMHIHLSETEQEVKDCFGRHGVSPVQFFENTGVLDCPTTAAHCVWVNEDDMDILREKNVFVAHNPVSNLKLGSGVMPMPRMLEKGLRVCIGTDGVASNNRLDVLRDMQTAAILHKGVQRQPDCTHAADMIALATRNGALSQGRDDCGLIGVGCAADLILVDTNAPHNRPSFDPYASLCYSVDASDIRMTMADGVILYENGEYTTIDMERVMANAERVFDGYFK